MNNSIIWIDVSKTSLDIASLDNEFTAIKIANSHKDITKNLIKFKNYTIFYESTWIYSNKLCKACNDMWVTHYQINPFVMCKVMDWMWDRNKTDKIDAKKIAQVWKMFLDMYQSKETKFKLINPSSNEISKLNHYVSVINSLRNQVSRFKQLIEKLDQDIYTEKIVIKFYQKQLKIFQKEQETICELLQKSLVEMGYW